MAAPWNVGLQPTGWYPQYGSAIPIIQYTSFSAALSATSTSSQIVASSSGYRVLVLGAAILGQTLNVVNSNSPCWRDIKYSSDGNIDVPDWHQYTMSIDVAIQSSWMVCDSPK